MTSLWTVVEELLNFQICRGLLKLGEKKILGCNFLYRNNLLCGFMQILDVQDPLLVHIYVGSWNAGVLCYQIIMLWLQAHVF